MKPEPFKKYLLEYYHEGSQWNISLHATSEEDARARAQQIYYARVLGTVEAEIPMFISGGGIFAKAICCVRNYLFRHSV